TSTPSPIASPASARPPMPNSMPCRQPLSMVWPSTTSTTPWTRASRSTMTSSLPRPIPPPPEPRTGPRPGNRIAGEPSCVPAAPDVLAKHHIEHTLDTFESIYDDVIAAAIDSSAAGASHRPADREQAFGRTRLSSGRFRWDEDRGGSVEAIEVGAGDHGVDVGPFGAGLRQSQ